MNPKPKSLIPGEVTKMLVVLKGRNLPRIGEGENSASLCQLVKKGVTLCEHDEPSLKYFSVLIQSFWKISRSLGESRILKKPYLDT